MDFIKWENLQFLRKVGSLGSTPKQGRGEGVLKSALMEEEERGYGNRYGWR